MKLLLPLALLLCALPASAGDSFVSASAGSDLSGDGSAANPWKTITHALGQPPPGHQHTVHAAPGVYDAALGETFPITLPAQMNLVGSGQGATILDAGGLDGIGIACAPGAQPRVRGLTLRNGVNGIFASAAYPAPVGPASATHVLADVAIEAMSGVAVSATSTLQVSAAVELLSVRISGCATGLSGIAIGYGLNALLVARDCVIEGCGIGVSGLVEQNPVISSQATVYLTLERTRVTDCVVGVVCTGSMQFGHCLLQALHSLVANCGTGIRAIKHNDIRFWYSTLARNGIGMSKTTPGSSETLLSLRTSVIWGNLSSDLFTSLPPYSAQYCDTPGGALVGDGNVSVDPQFVDAAHGDFRLLPTSPVIDRGYPGMTQVGADFQLDPRVLDGDGDGVARIDMGFDEWNPVHLDASGAPSLGASYGLTATAPAGWLAVLYVSGGTADIALGAPGNLLVDPATAAAVALGAAPFTWSVVVPVDPALVGLGFHAQALGVAPALAALGLSNRVDAAIQ